MILSTYLTWDFFGCTGWPEADVARTVPCDDPGQVPRGMMSPVVGAADAELCCRGYPEATTKNVLLLCLHSTSMACRHGMLPWRVATVGYHGTLQRCVTMISYHGMLQWWDTVVSCHGMLQWCAAAVSCYGSFPWHVAMVSLTYRNHRDEAHTRMTSLGNWILCYSTYDSWEFGSGHLGTNYCQ